MSALPFLYRMKRTMPRMIAVAKKTAMTTPMTAPMIADTYTTR